MSDSGSYADQTDQHTEPAITHRRRRRRRIRERPLVHRLKQALERSGRVAGTLSAVSSDQVLLVLVAGSVVVSVLAMGGARVDWLLWSAILPIAAALFGVWHWPAKLPAVALGLLALSAYSALQAVPLSRTLVATLSPTAAQTWQAAYEAAGEPTPTWLTVSLDPGASIVEAFKWMLYAGTFVAAAAYARRQGPARIALVVFLSALVVAAVSLAHGLAGARLLYGFYKPSFEPPPFGLSPLLNPNNLAGYLNLGAFAGLALLLSRQLSVHRPTLALGLCIVIAYSVVAASRAGMLAFALGCVALGAILLRSTARSKDERQSNRRSLTLLASLAAASILLVTLAGSTETWSELTSTSLVKLHAIASARHLIVAFPWLGTGRGAFASVFPAYRELKGHIVFHLAESFPVQWASEWGIPIALAAIAFFAWQFRPSRVPYLRSKLTTALFLGVLVLLLQNLVDLALELVGVCLALFIVLGALWGESVNRSPRVAGLSLRRRALRTAALGIGLLGTFAASVVWGRKDVGHDREALTAAYKKAFRSGQPQGFEGVVREAKAAIARHPGDPFIPLIAGRAARRIPGVDALPWVAHALERDPAEARAHLALAVVLHDRGVLKQALLELRLAHEADASLGRQATRMAVAWTASDPDLAWRVVGENSATDVLLSLARAAPLSSPMRLQALDRALKQDPRSLEANRAAAETLLALLLGSSGTQCATLGRTECIDRIHAYSKRMHELQPDATLPIELVARVDLATGKAARAIRSLSEQCERHQSSQSCWRLLVNAAAIGSDMSALNRAAKEYLGVACNDRDDCARVADWLGRVYERKGLWSGAATYYGRALAEASSVDAWVKFADATWHAGQANRALGALEQAERYTDKGQSHPEIKSLRERIKRSMIDPGPKRRR